MRRLSYHSGFRFKQQKYIRQPHELFNWNCVTTIIIICFNSSFTRGYTSTALIVVTEYIGTWAKTVKPNSKDAIISEMTLESAFSFPFILKIEVSYVLGALLANMWVPNIAKQYGRKGGIILINIINIFGALLAGYSKFLNMPHLFIAGEIFLGFHCGVNMTLAPLYIMELVPRKWKGKVGAFYSFFCSLGELAATVIISFVNMNNCWPLIFSLVIVPTILQLWILPFIPESPKYTFVMKKKILTAKKAFLWFRGKEMPDKEYAELFFELIQQQQLGSLTLKDLTEHEILLRAVLIAGLITCAVPLCGIRLIVKYVSAEVIFSVDSKDYSILHYFVHGSVLFMSVLNMFFIDVVSRDKLLIFSFSLMSIACFACWIDSVFFSFNIIILKIFTVIYLFGYKLGVGHLAYFITFEYFNTSAAPLASSLGMAVSCFIQCLEILYSDRLDTFLGDNLLLNYAIFNGALVYLCWAYVVDTRNVSIKVVYKKINRRAHS